MKTVTATKPINPLVTKRYLCMCVGIFVCINVHHRRFSPLATRHLFLGFSFSISFFSLIILSYEKKKKKHTHTQCVCGFDHIDRYFIIDNFDSLTPIYACLLIVSLDLLLLSAHFNWFFLRSLWFFFFCLDWFLEASEDFLCFVLHFVVYVYSNQPPLYFDLRRSWKWISDLDYIVFDLIGFN